MSAKKNFTEGEIIYTLQNFSNSSIEVNQVTKYLIDTYSKNAEHICKNIGIKEPEDVKDIFIDSLEKLIEAVQKKKIEKEGVLISYFKIIIRNKASNEIRRRKGPKKKASDDKHNEWDTTLADIPNKPRMEKLDEKYAATIPASEMTIDEELEKEELLSLLMKLINKRLSDKCKRLLKHFYFEELSWEKISDSLGITAESARNQKFRCMKKLRKYCLDNPQLLKLWNSIKIHLN